MDNLNCKGLACPAPVLRTKDYVETHKPSKIEVLVDNVAAAENVSRFLKYRGYEVDVKERGDEFILHAARAGDVDDLSSGDERKEVSAGEKRKILILVATNSFGSGDGELGEALMVNFLGTLKEMGDELWQVVFVNGGVKLTIEGAKTLGIIKDLEEHGVKILVCGTCLNHFKIIDKKGVGETTNMLDIVTAMQLADKVINIS